MILLPTADWEHFLWRRESILLKFCDVDRASLKILNEYVLQQMLSIGQVKNQIERDPVPTVSVEAGLRVGRSDRGYSQAWKTGCCALMAGQNGDGSS